jgi:basic amino acid/polyamine antiporter, APA family
MSLKRELSLLDAVLLIAGNVIGAGIFTTSGFLAGELPHPALFIGIWVMGGFLTICGALTYAEPAGMFPLAGGDYHYLKAAYGSWAGFLLGWISFWIIGPGSSAALSLALVSYLKIFMPPYGPFTEKLAATVVIAVFAVINIRGIRPGRMTQDIITIGTILMLFTMILGGLLAGSGNWHNFAAGASPVTSWTRLFSTPMIAVIFTYSGWFASAYMGSEIRNPERNLPLSLIIGTLVVTAVYTLMNVMYLYGLPLIEMKGSINTAQAALSRLFNPELAGFVSLPVILAIASSINANILTGARVCYAMADDRTFWNIFRKLHTHYNTPHTGILCQSGIAVLMVFAGTFSELLGYVGFFMVLTSVASGISVFVLRRRFPAHPRPYRVWGYPLVPVLFVAPYIIIALEIATASPKTSILGLAIALSGLPLFFFWRVKSRRSVAACPNVVAEE